MLFWNYSGYIIVFLPFLAKFFLFCILFYIWTTTVTQSCVKIPLVVAHSCTREMARVTHIVHDCYEFPHAVVHVKMNFTHASTLIKPKNGRMACYH
jgi:hypothetical protein